MTTSAASAPQPAPLLMERGLPEPGFTRLESWAVTADAGSGSRQPQTAEPGWARIAAGADSAWQAPGGVG